MQASTVWCAMTKQFMAKFLYGKNSHRVVYLRRSVLAAKFPCDEVFVGRSVRTANCLTPKCPTTKSPKAKSPVTETTNVIARKHKRPSLRSRNAYETCASRKEGLLCLQQ